MNRIVTASAAALVAILAAGTLSGCSSDPATGSNQEDANTSSWSPIRIGPDFEGKVLELKVGEVAYLDQLPSARGPYTLVSANPSVAAPLPATDDTTTSTVLPDPGITALSVGTTEIVVREAGKQDGDPVLTFTVNVE